MPSEGFGRQSWCLADTQSLVSHLGPKDTLM